MSDVQDYANHFLRFFIRNNDGTHSLADNAPSSLWKFVSAHSDLNRELVYDAILGLATRKVPPPKTIEQILVWFAKHPQSTVRCDEILQGKQKVTSFNKLMEKAYSLERSRVTDQVHNFILGLTTIK
jgi:hypothetical protein